MKKSINPGRYYLRTVASLACAAACLTGCKTPTFNYYKGFNKSALVEPNISKGRFNPTGMVYIPSGSIMYGEKKVSVSAFYIDEAEVTNRQYRIFAAWVADSIAVTDYLKDEKFFKRSNKKGKKTDSLTQSPINWTVVRKYSPLWMNKSPEIASKLSSLSEFKGGELVLKTDLIKYRLTYIKANGKNANDYVTEFIPVYPKQNIWSTDFPNTQMEIMDMNYFRDKTYDHHPVVGVNWKQARSFADWRGKTIPLIITSNPYLPKLRMTVSLPTEAQWQLAAGGNTDDSLDAKNLYTIEDKKLKTSMLGVNFKQGEGDYSQDGGTFTLPVRSYARNSFGLYNAEGNVSEWVLDAYSPSSFELTNDLNPVLKYDANDDEAAIMKRKVVRGGSWKDSATDVNSKTRGYDIQDAQHSYLGFRCVLPAYELPADQVKSRVNKSKTTKK